ncbi:glycosyltransferase family 4 protein [Lewinella sp. LCG006]|uniref:glycosyltransferase family 4 protein n=1 Tax=Lewinella sp. LCG006 TaxID=3231911 RepID=UPI00345F7060
MSNNKRIAILADPLDNQSAGVHVFTKELINALINMGKADQLLLIREKYDPDLNIEQIVVPNIHLPIGFASLRLFFIIPWILSNRGVAAVFEPAHFGPFNLPHSIKRMTMIHDLTPLIFPHHHRWHSQLLQKIFLKGILRRTDWVFTNSKHTSKDVEQFFPFTENKIKHLYLGKHSVFQPTKNPARLKELGINVPYFIYVGTIEPRKNLVLLLNAFATFCLENKDQEIALIMVGQMGWKSTRFEEAFAAHPYREKIKLLGFVDFSDLPILYTHATALIYPSMYEGFGLPIIEALACGTDVITANNSSLTEIGEGAAFFFETDDTASLVACMEEVFFSKENRSLKNQLHAEKFSWAQCALDFWQKVEEVIK